VFLASGCGKDIPRIRTVSLTGDTAGLRNLEGQWFDRDGLLILEISGGRNPSLSVLLPPWLHLTGAHAEGDNVTFRTKSDLSGEHGSSTLDRVGEEEIVIHQRRSPGAIKAGCLYGFDIERTGLVHDPSAAWVLEQSAKRNTRMAGELIGKARDGILDHIARIL
jgi:hypothetical protein